MKRFFTTAVILVMIAVLGTAFYKLYFVKYSYTEDRADTDAYYGVEAEDDYPVVLEDELSEHRCVMIDDEISTGRTIENIVTQLRIRFPHLQKTRFVKS